MADKYDLYVQGKTEENTTGFRYLTTGFERSVGVRGPQKLVLHWLKRFLTTVGSDPTNLETGTEFPNLIGSNVTEENDLRDVVLLAIQDCNDQIFEVQRETQPDEDEQLLTAILSRFELKAEGDGFDAYVTISNVAGAELTIQLPDLATRT
ncbi:MAG: hypothetical protein ACYTEQ_15905 [Planctomycetota bacterium]|jgi:hypothetical protein